MNKFISITLLLVAIVLPVTAQRVTDKLDRGLVAVPGSNGGNLVSWRIFAEEYYDYTYNLYCDGTLLASGLSASNYSHQAGNASSTYQVAPVFRGTEGELCQSVTRWNNGFLEIPVASAVDRNGNNANSHYYLGDVTLGDLDGDGVTEFIVKRECDAVNDVNQNIMFHLLDCYDHKGNRLWWIDMGPNMLSGPDDQWDCITFDWDEDGKSEVLLRIQDNAIIHYADGSHLNIGNMNLDTRNTVNTGDGNMAYTNTGNEYLLYLEGATGRPYQIGPDSHPDYMNYPVSRGSASDWGDGYGHRSTKHYFAAPYLDGHHASIFLGRGCYTKHVMMAFDVDHQTHHLTQRWAWQNNVGGSPWFGQGYHNFQVADVDWDGRDEIVFGSMVIDDNGKGLSTSGLGHGDSQHCSDFDPFRKYQEQFACNEDHPANNYRNALTSELYYRQAGGGDDGRALMGNFTNDYPGSVGRSVGSGWISSTSDKIIGELNGDAFINWGDLNSRIYWDGDLLDEYLESPGTEGYAVVYKPAGTGNRLLSATDTKMNNYTKNNPGAQGDIFGDWREEIVLRKADNSALRVYTTGYPTTYRIPALWHDHQYRNAMVWQSMGYNQCPHKSYFLGELEGITAAPAPLTMTGRTEVANGGTITTTDEHLIVCENNNTEITVQDGANPYIVTFNVPSWVQGNAGSDTSAKPDPTYTYYTCTVNGGGFSGDTRLVKQGEGILSLPAVAMNHSGKTDVWAGTLNFDGTMPNSDLWLNRFAVLNSNGGSFRSIKADYGSVIRPGGEASVGNITVDGTLRLGFGSRLVLDVDGVNAVSDQISAAILVVDTKSWQYGPKYLCPVIELNAIGGELAEGRYFIGQLDSIRGSLSDIRIEGTGSFKAGLELEGSSLYLSLGSVRGSSHIVWTGSENNVWDYATTPNFALLSDPDMTPEVFVSGDMVDFLDGPSVRSVSLSDEVEVDTLRVNNTQGYTIEGAGAIVGGALVKEGSGKLIMSSDNTYSGGNYLRGGTVMVKSLANAVQKYGNLGSATASALKFTMENGAVLNNTAAVQNGSAMRMLGDDGGVIQCGASFEQQKLISGTLLTKKGSGSLTLQAECSGLQRLVIAAGTVHTSASKPAQTVELQGGTLNLNGNSDCALEVPEGKTATVNYNGDRAVYDNRLTGSGTVTFYYPLVRGSGWNASRAAVNGDWSEFSGTVKPTGLSGDGRFCFNNSHGLPLATLNIASDVIVENTARTFAIGSLTGSGSLGGVCALSSTSPGSWSTWNVGCDDDFSFSGKVTGAAIFNKVGSGTMTASGAWDNTGAVTVREGKLKLSTNSSLGSGNLVIESGAKIIGAMGSNGRLNNSSVTVHGVLQPGMGETLASGTLRFNGQKVTISTDGTLRIGVLQSSTGQNSLSGADIANVGELVLDGTLSLYFGSGFVPSAGDELRLWTSVGTVSGSPSIVVDDYDVEFDTSRLSEGVLVVVSVTGIDRVSAFVSDADAVSLSGQRINPSSVQQPGSVVITRGCKRIIR